MLFWSAVGNAFTAAGLIATLVGLVITAQSLRAAEEALQVSRAQLDAANEANSDGRLTQQFYPRFTVEACVDQSNSGIGNTTSGAGSFVVLTNEGRRPVTVVGVFAVASSVPQDAPKGPAELHEFEGTLTSVAIDVERGQPRHGVVRVDPGAAVAVHYGYNGPGTNSALKYQFVLADGRTERVLFGDNQLSAYMPAAVEDAYDSISAMLREEAEPSAAEGRCTV